jgi:hypothetical protein
LVFGGAASCIDLAITAAVVGFCECMVAHALVMHAYVLPSAAAVAGLMTGLTLAIPIGGWWRACCKAESSAEGEELPSVAVFMAAAMAVLAVPAVLFGLAVAAMITAGIDHAVRFGLGSPPVTPQDKDDTE